MSALHRKPTLKKLPLLRGLLRITGDTLEGPRETDAFEVVATPNGGVAIVLLDLQTRQSEPGDLARNLLGKATRGLAELAPLHAIMLDLVRAMFEFPGSEARITLLRCDVADARVELALAGMPAVACAQPDGTIAVYATSSGPLTSTTTAPPPVEVIPLVWGSTWMAVSDGFTAGSHDPELVRRLAQDLDLCETGLALSGQSPDALYDALASRVSESGRFSRDDATLVLLGADPHARSTSGIRSDQAP